MSQARTGLHTELPMLREEMATHNLTIVGDTCNS